MSKLPFSGLEVFTAVAHHGSLRRAASALGVRPPAVSYQLKVLEEQIGTPLFFRTTRKVSLTDAGRELLSRVEPALSEISGALDDVRNQAGATSGRIRITLPYVAYQLTFADKLRDFHRLYPDIEIEMSFNEAFVDIVAEGFHAGVRMGDHVHNDMIAVRLCPPLKQAVFASPEYLDAFGRPERPTDLLQHNCIRYRYIASQRFAEWQFRMAADVATVGVRGNLIVNSTSALLSAARQGLGIGWLFRPSIAEDIAAGALATVLDEFSVERPGYFLYFPKANTRLQAFRVFVDFMKLRP